MTEAGSQSHGQGSAPADPGAASPPADEFADVPSPRRRHPAVALGAVLLAALLIYQLRADLAYVFSSSTPRDLGEAASLRTAAPEALPLNRLVKLRGRPDRESAVVLDTQGSWVFSQFFRLLDSGGRVYVNRAPDPLPAPAAERDVFIGRLIRLSDLSFQDSIRAHFGNRVTATHLFDRTEIVTALARPERPLVVKDMLGERVTVGAGDELTLDTAPPDELRIELSPERFSDAAAARAALEQAGTHVLSFEAAQGQGARHAAVVSLPADRRPPVFAALTERDARVRFRPARTAHKARLSELRAEADALVVGSGDQARRVPLAHVQGARLLATVNIPDDALLVREGDLPGGHLKTVLIAAFLVVFALLNLLGLRRSV